MLFIKDRTWISTFTRSHLDFLVWSNNFSDWKQRTRDALLESLDSAGVINELVSKISWNSVGFFSLWATSTSTKAEWLLPMSIPHISSWFFSLNTTKAFLSVADEHCHFFTGLIVKFLAGNFWKGRKGFVRNNSWNSAMDGACYWTTHWIFTAKWVYSFFQNRHDLRSIYNFILKFTREKQKIMKMIFERGKSVLR